MNHHFRQSLIGLASLFSVAIFLSPATAATLINDDAGEYVVLISANGQDKELLVNGNSQVDDICKTCTITLENGNSLKVEESIEVVIIREGELGTE